MSPLSALLVDLVMTACWPLIGALGMEHASGILFTASGLLVGGATLAPVLISSGRWRRLLERRTALPLLAIGFFSGVASVIFISALAYTTPANAAIMAQIEVLYSALLCAFFLRERITRSQAAASVLIVAGTGLVMLHDLDSPRWRGDLMMLATPWMFQVSHMFSKRLPKDIDPVTLSGGRILFGLLAISPFAAYAIAHGSRWSWAPRAMGIVLVQGVMMSCLNILLWYRAIRGMDLSKATAIILSYPALTVVFSWALGREPIGGTQLLGLAVTMSGAYWMSMLVLRASRGGLQPETPGTDLVP